MEMVEDYKNVSSFDKKVICVLSATKIFKHITMNNSNFCNNCGNNGHYFYQCKKPITSIGIIAINYDTYNKKHKYLMICRKDSLGYIEFIRGKYPLDDIEYIKNIINEMTIKEKNNLLTMGFKELWDKGFVYQDKKIMLFSS